MRAMILPLCGVLLAGCMLSNATTRKRLGDTVNLMNRNTRWGQLADAARMVEPGYRPMFMASHRGWGQALQVADSEVVNVELAEDKESALALINYQWYVPDNLTLHETVVRQRWSKNGSAFLLISEAVVQGDGRLLGKTTETPKVMTADDSTVGFVD